MKRQSKTEFSPPGVANTNSGFSNGASHQDKGSSDVEGNRQLPATIRKTSGRRRKRTDDPSKTLAQDINLLEVRSSVAGIAGLGGMPNSLIGLGERLPVAEYLLSPEQAPDSRPVKTADQSPISDLDSNRSIPEVAVRKNRSAMNAIRDKLRWTRETVRADSDDSVPTPELGTSILEFDGTSTEFSVTADSVKGLATGTTETDSGVGDGIGTSTGVPMAPGDEGPSGFGGMFDGGFSDGRNFSMMLENGGSTGSTSPVVTEDPDGPIVCAWPPYVHFEKPIGAAQEGHSNSVMLRLSPFPDRIVAATYTEPVYIDLEHIGLTATTETDYLVHDDDTLGDHTQMFVIPVGQTGRLLPIQHHSDTIAEGLEDFRLQITGVQNGVAGNYNSFKGIISDEPLDGPPDVFFLDTFRNGGEGESFAVRVGLSHPSLEVIRATVSPESLSAVFGQDFMLLNSSGNPVNSFELEFQPGEQVRQFSVQLLQDGISEPREEYLLRINSATGATISSPDTFVGWVNDEIPSGDAELTFVRSPAMGVEGTTVNFVVGLTVPSDVVVSANIVAESLSATSGTDFALQTTSVVFQPGETGKTVAVAHFTDAFVEQQEVYRVSLANIVNAATGPMTFAEGLIVDQSQAPKIFFADVSGSGMEGETETIRVQLTNAAPFQVRVNVVATNTGSANHPRDYKVLQPSVTFVPGETSRLVNVLLKNDEVQDEGLENYKLQLANPQGATIVETADEFAGYIEDADPAAGPLIVFDVTANAPVADNSGVANFGSTQTDVPVIHEFRVTNQASRAIELQFSRLSLPIGYELVGQISDTTVAANSSFSFSVRLLSETEGNFQGRLVLPNTSSGPTNPYDFILLGIVRPDLPPGVEPLPVITLPEDFQGIYNGFNIYDLFSDSELSSSSLIYTVYRIDKYGLTDALSLAVSPDPNPPQDYFPPPSDLRPVLVEPVESVAVTSNGMLDFSLVDDAYGFSHFLILARNPNTGLEVATTLMVEVTPVNDSPYILSPLNPQPDQQQRPILASFSRPIYSPVVVDLWKYFSDFEDAGYLKFTVNTDNESIFHTEPAINPGQEVAPPNYNGPNNYHDDGILAWRFGHLVGSANVEVTATDRNGQTKLGVFQVSTVQLTEWTSWYGSQGAGAWNSFWGGYYGPNGWMDPHQEDGEWNARASFIDIADSAFANSYVETNNGFAEQGLVERYVDQIAPDGSTKRVRQLAWQSDLLRDRDLRNAYTDFLELNSPFNSAKQPGQFSEWYWNQNAQGSGWLNDWFEFNQIGSQPKFDWANWANAWSNASAVTGRPALLAYGWEYSNNGDASGNFSYFGGDGTITFDFGEDIKLWLPAGLLYADDFGTEELMGAYADGHLTDEPWYGANAYGYPGFGFGNYGLGWHHAGWLGNGELRQVQPGKAYHVNPWSGWTGGGWGWGTSGWGGWWSEAWGGPWAGLNNPDWTDNEGSVRSGPWGAVGMSWDEMINTRSVAVPSTLPVFIEGVSPHSISNSIPGLTVNLNLKRHWLEAGPAIAGQTGNVLQTASDTASAPYHYQGSDFSAGFHVPPNPLPVDGPNGPASLINKHADLLVNSGDADNDGIPDFEDGFNQNGVSNGTGYLDDELSLPGQTGFKELWIRIPKGVHKSAQLKFNLQGVIDRYGEANMDATDTGRIRIWNTNADRRSHTSVTANGNLVFGSYLETDGKFQPASIPLNKLTGGISGDYTNETRFIKLYVEALSPGRSALELALEFNDAPSSAISTGVRVMQAHGAALVDRIFFTNRDTVSVRAVDRYASERLLRSSVGETGLPAGRDVATFRFDRREANSPATVFFRLTGIPSTAVNTPQNSATPPGWLSADFRLKVPQGTYLFLDPHTLVGAIQLTGASVEMDVEALTDGLVEVDEEIGVELLSREQMLERLLRPETSALNSQSSPVPMVLLDLLRLDNGLHSDPPVGNPTPGIVDTLARSWYVVDPVATSATITIHDADGIEIDSRAYDPISTEDSRNSVVSQYVSVDTRDGAVSLLLPIDGMIPRYNGGDNLTRFFHSTPNCHAQKSTPRLLLAA